MLAKLRQDCTSHRSNQTSKTRRAIPLQLGSRGSCCVQSYHKLECRVVSRDCTSHRSNQTSKTRRAIPLQLGSRGSCCVQSYHKLECRVVSRVKLITAAGLYLSQIESDKQDTTGYTFAAWQSWLLLCTIIPETGISNQTSRTRRAIPLQLGSRGSCCVQSYHKLECRVVSRVKLITAAGLYLSQIESDKQDTTGYTLAACVSIGSC
ncbi:hypothetical protein J6590_030278 [Homalodisca vitripennis]|nr:hypothetical protein J6590_030278 [Homalodisca vitripennis]